MNGGEGTILIVEDEVELQSIYVSILENIASHIFISNNGKEALELLAKEEVDTILTDYHMPILSGLEFIREIMWLNKTIPIVMVTANATQEVKTAATIYGVLRVISKPANFSELTRLVKNSLEANQRIKEIEKEFLKLIQNEKAISVDRKTELLRVKRERVLKIMKGF